MIDKNFLLGYGAGFSAAERPITTSPLVVTENGAYSPGIGKAYSRVKVNVIDGRGGVSPSDVTFYDYNGVVVYAYTAAEFMALDAMPDNPTHNGLTAQGWNCTLSDAKTYVASYGKLNIWQMYITDDGKTRIYITLQEGRLSPYLGLAVNGSVGIDWGDGSQHDTLTGTSTSALVFVRHFYANAGNYVITLDPDNRSEFAIKGATECKLLSANGQLASDTGDYAYNIAIKSVKIGRRITSIGASAFQNCHSLTSVTIPSSVTSIEQSAFSSCFSLMSITIPSSVTSIGAYVFRFCDNLTSVTIPSSVTSIGVSVFQNCYSLTSVTIPSSVTSIGQSAFQSCYNLTSVTIPSSVTSIGVTAFQNCYSIAAIHFKRSTPPTISNANAFGNLPTDCIIYVPASADHSVLNAYKAASNYPDPTVYTYMEE